jgi:hypothetical protein
MKKSMLLLFAVVLPCLVLMPGKMSAADDAITSSQFKGMIALLNPIDHGKSTLVAVQGNRTIDITEFAQMKQISMSGIKTAFYLRDDKTGAKKQIAIYEPSETGKSISRDFWGLACRGAGLCQSCTQLFGDNPCK